MGIRLSGATAIVTGASRGIGIRIARALAREGCDLCLAARSAPELEAVAEEVRRLGRRAVVVSADVSDKEACRELVARAEKELGAVDVLVNNAGIEATAEFHRYPLEKTERMVAINLLGPMTLTWHALPGMLQRGRGHIINVASLAGKVGPPLSEPYAATKAGLIGFTQALRASYEGTGVSASAVCPGFVSEAGMFADRQKKNAEVKPPALMGSSTPDEVAAGVVRAIRDDLPEVIVNPGPNRLMAAATQLFPRLPFAMIRRMKLRELYAKTME